jgi:two-component system, chemotaxis family, protein-glutamate methylesterase/glutaminase
MEAVMAIHTAGDASHSKAHGIHKYRVVTIGCSAGSFDGLCELLSELPSEFPCPVVVVFHLHPDYKSVMPDLVGHRTRLRVQQVENGGLEAGVVYIGKPDHHVVFSEHGLRLDHGVAIHHARPSVDVLFESAAREYGPSAIAVVLSGAGCDGATGIRAIKGAGGVTIVQLPKSAQFSSMPEAAIATGCVDLVLPLGKIGEALQELCN